MNHESTARKLFWRRSAIPVVIGVFVLLLFLSCVFAMVMDWVYTIGKPAVSDTLLVYEGELGSKSFLRDYRNQRRVTVTAANENRTVTLADIPEIVTRYSVKETYIADLQRLSEIPGEASATNGVRVYAFPTQLYESVYGGAAMQDLLTEAKLADVIPKDGAKEAVMSEAAAKRFGIDPKNFTGAKITVDGTEYTVIGVWSSDDPRWVKFYDTPKVFLSYDPAENRGVYRYSADTYEEFCSRQTAYLAVAGTSSQGIDTAMFTGTGEALEMTDEMSAAYPGAWIYSTAFYNVVTRAAVREQVIYTLLVLLLPAALSETIIDAVLAASEKKAFRTLQDRKTEDKESIKKLFKKQYVILWVLLAAIGAGMIVGGATLGFSLQSIILLSLYVIVTIGWAAFVYARGGVFTSRRKKLGE